MSGDWDKAQLASLNQRAANRTLHYKLEWCCFPVMMSRLLSVQVVVGQFCQSLACQLNRSRAEGRGVRSDGARLAQDSWGGLDPGGSMCRWAIRFGAVGRTRWKPVWASVSPDLGRVGIIWIDSRPLPISDSSRSSHARPMQIGDFTGNSSPSLTARRLLATMSCLMPHAAGKHTKIGTRLRTG